MKPCKDHGLKGGKQGYARWWFQGKKQLAHRVAFFKASGFWPPVVMHTCDNPRCVEPEHLVAGTWALNNADRAAKGRSTKRLVAKRKLTSEQAEIIRSRYSPVRCRINGVSALAREFNVDCNVIYQIVQGRTYV